MSMQVLQEAGLSPSLTQLDDSFQAAATGLGGLMSTMRIEHIDSARETMVSMDALSARHQLLMATSAAFIAAAEKAGDTAKASTCRTRTNELSKRESNLQVSLKQKLCDLVDRVTTMDAASRDGRVRSASIKNLPRPAMEQTADNKEPEVALARLAMERSDIDSVPIKLEAEEKNVQDRSESCKSIRGSISLQSAHSRVGDWVATPTSGINEEVSEFVKNSDSAAPAIAMRDETAAETEVVPVNTTEETCHQSSKIRAPEVVSSPVTDPVLRSLLIAELKKAPKNPYAGELLQFHPWLQSLCQRMDALQVQPLDAIEVLASHSTGAPLNIIKIYSMDKLDGQAKLQHILNVLKERFGSSQMIADYWYDNLLLAPKIGDSDLNMVRKLKTFGKLCQSVSDAMELAPDLRLLDMYLGLKPVIQKLPDFVFSLWLTKCSNYEKSFLQHPKFQIFCDFIKSISDRLRDDSEILSDSEHLPSSHPNTKMTRVLLESSEAHRPCAFHPASAHETLECFAVKKMDSATRRRFMQDKGLCYRCLGPHRAAVCREVVKCDSCGSSKHHTLAHSRHDEPSNANVNATPRPSHPRDYPRSRQEGRSFSKVVLADVYDPLSERTCRVYVIIAEQCNISFCSPSLLDEFGITGPRLSYSLRTLAPPSGPKSGRFVNNLMIKGVTEEKSFNLPRLIEINNIPDLKYEVATREIVEDHPRISCYAKNFLPLDSRAEVAIILGADSNHLLAKTLKTTKPPYVYQTPLGWALVGAIKHLDPVCTDMVSLTVHATVHYD
ncbi:uncharacterized protein LOC108664615 [Hyalella azteca]|uniref:Uncharacterized protein LOC108664615 n=1 Tax=Hyalella azteca TaxID=294128 RepID=A0A8B7N0I6_HYAAZ|nr:uncharacterized protein LOC108664615 [Hyalella azteca]XP_047740968.1 uncharacterized protein LOC108664615 [Hyalella azteca]